jgi:hypothetical protein
MHVYHAFKATFYRLPVFLIMQPVKDEFKHAEARHVLFIREI